MLSVAVKYIAKIQYKITDTYCDQDGFRGFEQIEDKNIYDKKQY